MNRGIRAAFLFAVTALGCSSSSPGPMGPTGAAGATGPQGLPGDATKAQLTFDYWDSETTHAPAAKQVSLPEYLCASRHGIWDASSATCKSPLVYGTAAVTRTVTEAEAIATCPSGYTPADCATAMFLERFWRLNPNREVTGGYAWCAGTVDGELNTVNAKTGMPGFWYQAGANAPAVCSTGNALVVDQCAPGENGCVGRASPYRPHFYCVPEASSAVWMCMAIDMP